MKKLIKAEVHELPAEALVGKAGYILQAMNGNSHFPDPLPALAIVDASRLRLRKALEEAKDFSRPAIVAKNLAAEELRSQLGALAEYVNVVSMGDLLVALSSGFEERKKRASVLLISPELLIARRGAREGSIELEWRRVPGVRMFNVYMTTGEVTSDSIWTCVAQTSRIRYIANGLRRDAYFSFRVTAVGAAGEGLPSAISTAKAA